MRSVVDGKATDGSRPASGFDLQPFGSDLLRRSTHEKVVVRGGGVAGGHAPAGGGAGPPSANGGAPTPPIWKFMSSVPAATATWNVTFVSLPAGMGSPGDVPQLLSGYWKKTPAQLHTPVLLVMGVVYGPLATYWKL